MYLACIQWRWITLKTRLPDHCLMLGTFDVKTSAAAVAGSEYNFGFDDFVTESTFSFKTLM